MTRKTKATAKKEHAPWLLTLTDGSMKGGVETFSSYLRQTFPGLQTISRENIADDLVQRIPFPPLNEPKTGWALARELEKKNPQDQVVFVNGLLGWSLDSKKMNVPVVNLLHGTYTALADAAYQNNHLLHARMKHVYGYFEGRGMRNATACVANSKQTQKEAMKFFGIKTELIELPIDTKRFTPGNKKKARAQLGWDENETVVLFVGSATYSKGWDIFTQLAHDNPTFTFRALTTPSTTRALAPLHYHPLVAHEQTPLYYQAADVLIFPSRYESFGFVPLEALACNTPVISSPIGVLAELKLKGLTCVPHSLENYQDALNQVVHSHPTVNTHPAIAKRFNYNLFAQSYRKLHARLLP